MCSESIMLFNYEFDYLLEVLRRDVRWQQSQTGPSEEQEMQFRMNARRSVRLLEILNPKRFPADEVPLPFCVASVGAVNDGVTVSVVPANEPEYSQV